MFNCGPDMKAEWKPKLWAYMRVVANRGPDQWIAWASERDTRTVEEGLDDHFEDAAGDVKDLSVSLSLSNAQLVSNTTDSPSSLLNNSSGGNALDTMRVVMRRLEP